MLSCKSQDFLDNKKPTEVGLLFWFIAKLVTELTECEVSNSNFSEVVTGIPETTCSIRELDVAISRHK